MELTHQLTPMLRTLRLSGILETLEVRNRQAVEARTSFVEFLTLLLQDEVERRAPRCAGRHEAARRRGAPGLTGGRRYCPRRHFPRRHPRGYR